MTQAEKTVLEAIVKIIENLITRFDALEGALIGKALLPEGLVAILEPNYRQAAVNDLAQLRIMIAALESI